MRPALVCSLHGVALTLSHGACTPAPFDVLLRGGRVLDGTGAPATVADVGIREGRIVEIGDLGTRTAADTVDVTGHVVAPGFIDPHTRGRERLRDIPTAVNLIRQGMGTANRPATPDELAAMEALVRQAMADGAVGLSSGLFYVPGRFAPTEELVALARVAYAAGGIYSSHMRNEDDSVLAAVTETIRIGRETGSPVLISHHKVGGRRNYGRTVQSLALMREARDAGITVAFDQYHCTASHTSIASIIPAWARAEDGLEGNLARAATRQHMLAEMQAFVTMRFSNDPSKIQLARCGFDATLAGRTLADVLSAPRRLRPLFSSSSAAVAAVPSSTLSTRATWSGCWPRRTA